MTFELFWDALNLWILRNVILKSSCHFFLTFIFWWVLNFIPSSISMTPVLRLFFLTISFLSVTATVFKNHNFRCTVKYYNIYRRDNPCLYSLKNHIRLLTRTSKNETWDIFKDLIYCVFQFETKAVLNIHQSRYKSEFWSLVSHK